MAKKLNFELVSPSALLASEEVDMVVVPGEDGDFGVLPGHAPLLSNVRPGTINIYNDGFVYKSIFVEGGFFLAIALLLHIYKYSKYMLVFLIVSGLHYIFIINIPFTLFLVLQFNKKISYSSIHFVKPQS